jgi:hypothetical protein
MYQLNQGLKKKKEGIVASITLLFQNQRMNHLKPHLGRAV